MTAATMRLGRCPDDQICLLVYHLQLGNTCYANSILTSLYFCRPFRDLVLNGFVQDPATSTPTPTAPTAPSGPPLDIEPSGSKGDELSPGSTEPDTSNEPQTLFSALQQLFASIEKATADHAPPSPATPTRTSTPRGQSSSGKASKAATKDTKTKQPTRPPSAAGSGRVGAPVSGASASTAHQAQATQNGAGYVKRKDQGISAGLVDHELLVAFLAVLRRGNVLFNSKEHQDAHECLNWMLNRLGDEHEEMEQKRIEEERSRKLDETTVSMTALPKRPLLAVQKLFQGMQTSETRCLTCESVTSRDDPFLDLQIDLQHNTSITACLRQYSASETLRARDKFYCDTCSGLQEAERRTKIGKLPPVLALHLKRFRFEDSNFGTIKLAYRVVFPFELRLFNTTDDADDPDRLYQLFGIVVHIGPRQMQGHYISIVKVGSKWAVFDDDAVHYIDQVEIAKYFGDSPTTGSAYVLFYQSADLDREALGLPEVTVEETKAKILPLAMANMAANPEVKGVDGVSAGPGTSPAVNLLSVPTVTSPTGSASPLSSISGSGGSPGKSSPSSGGNEAGPSNLWTRRRGNSNSLAQAAEQARAAVDGAVKNSGNKSKEAGAQSGVGSSWRNPFGKSKEKTRRSGSVSESTPSASLPGQFSDASIPPIDPNRSNEYVGPGATTPPTARPAPNGAIVSDSVSALTADEAAMTASQEFSSAANSSPSLSRGEWAHRPAGIDHGDTTNNVRAVAATSDDQSAPPLGGVPSPILEQPSPSVGPSTPSRPQRNPSRPETTGGQQRVAESPPHASPKVGHATFDGGQVGRSPPVRSATLPPQGAAFAPLDRPLTKKEQHKVAKHAARRRSSTGVPAGSVLPGQLHGAGGSEHAPHSHSHSAHLTGMPPPPPIPDAPLGHERRMPSTFSAAGGHGEDAAEAKTTRRRSTLSRALGFGKKDKEKK